MGFDQPRYQCASAAIDGRRAGNGPQALTDLLDEVSFDQHVLPQSQLLIRAVEDVDVGNEHLS